MCVCTEVCFHGGGACLCHTGVCVDQGAGGMQACLDAGVRLCVLTCANRAHRFLLKVGKAHTAFSCVTLPPGPAACLSTAGLLRPPVLVLTSRAPPGAPQKTLRAARLQFCRPSRLHSGPRHLLELEPDSGARGACSLGPMPSPLWVFSSVKWAPSSQTHRKGLAQHLEHSEGVPKMLPPALWW